MTNKKSGDDDEEDGQLQVEDQLESCKSAASGDQSSSGNSSVEEDERKAGTDSSTGGPTSGSVRPYNRSKNPRLRWTPDLHLCFVHAVERLGGQDRATPKLVLQMMNVKGLSIAHVKSHLQMYRSKKIDDGCSQAGDQGFIFGSGDNHHHHVYNLSQLPMIQSFNQRLSPSCFRFGDSTLRTHDQDHKIYTSPLINMARPKGLYSSITYHKVLTPATLSSRMAADHRSSLLGGANDYMIKPQLGEQTKSVADQLVNLKRKSLELDLDLELSLKMARKDDGNYSDQRSEVVDNGNLSLSLSSSSSSRPSRLKEGDYYNYNSIHETRKAARTKQASTLDLTL